MIYANGIKAVNTQVDATEMIEANQKAINEIYLTTVGRDGDTVTTAQAAVLFDIADQCPMIGGNAVFMARSLYWWKVDDAQGFDDPLLCLPHGIIVRSVVERAPNAVIVVPNPASEEATLVLDQEQEEPMTFMLFNTVGKEVKRITVPAHTLRFPFSTAPLAPALYHFQVRGPSGLLGSGKLTIIH
jgi:hypothetical protein